MKILNCVSNYCKCIFCPIYIKHCKIKWFFVIKLVLFRMITANVLPGPATTTTTSNGEYHHQINSSSIVALASSTLTAPNCASVFHSFESRGIKSDEIPRKPVNEIVLRYCELSPVGTCCSYNMETKLVISSKHQFEQSTKELIQKLHSVLGTRAQKFNEFFTQLLIESKKEFHAMFKRTYGVIYEQNAYVFSDFFSELETYFARGKIDLTEAMDSFFNTLYQKLFTVLNAQYTFDDKYLGCISEHMKELKPFGDVPDKLSVQIKRSFVATRTYAQALNVAADVAKNMINIRPTPECTAAMTKMQQCGLCKGYKEKPCFNYCANVVKGCLQYYNELDIEWDNFVSSMEKIAERLLGPFNIVMVVEPINIKISEAIMNFQETGQEITKQVFQGCGRPVLGLQKRNVHDMSIKTTNDSSLFHNFNTSYNNNQTTKEISHRFNKRETSETISDEDILYGDDDSSPSLSSSVIKHHHNDDSDDLPLPPNIQSDGNSRRRNNKKNKNKHKSGSKSNEDSDMTKEPILDKLIKDIRQKVKDSKKFWSNLPYQICNNEELALQPGTNDLCWNGDSISSNSESTLNSHYSQSITSSGSTSSSRQTTIVGNQLYYLKTAINHLRNAYNGQDVEWTDQEESYYGSGSGSGNGMDYDDEDNGSGINPFEKVSPHSPEHIDTSSVHTNNHNPTVISTTDSKHSSTSLSPSDNDNSIYGSSKDSGSTSNIKKMSLRRTLITYLLPICVAWLGGIISDLL